MKTNWKKVAGEFMPPTPSIALWIYLMIMIVGYWHYSLDIWDNWLKPIARSIRKVALKAVGNVTKSTEPLSDVPTRLKKG